MDEAPERLLNTVVLFWDFVQLHDFKLIVASATLNAQKFSNFSEGNLLSHKVWSSGHVWHQLVECN